MNQEIKNKIANWLLNPDNPLDNEEGLFSKLKKEGLENIFNEIELPLVDVLRSMEELGIKINKNEVKKLLTKYNKELRVLEKKIYKEAGEEFNINSPQQLSKILFEKLDIKPRGRATKSGLHSTRAEKLQELKEEHPIINLITKYRESFKIKSTYLEPLFKLGDRVHTTFLQTSTATGRLSSQNPNLQNIPIRSEEGRKIREAFVADTGKTLVALDYSQIELRILAHIADIQSLKQAFADGIDIHALTASQMFDVPLDQMTPEVRRKAKAINFGVIYGISGFGLARNLRIPRVEAQAFIDTYFERFPGIRTYMDDTVAFAKEHGYVQTLFGRRIHTPEISAKGPHAGFAKRAAINAPIQGTAADVIRRAMVRMPAAIAHLPAKMLLQVHDELLFEVEDAAVKELTQIAKRVMEGASLPVVKLDVPLIVESGSGPNWAQAH